MNKEELKKYLIKNPTVLTELIEELNCYCDYLENLKFTITNGDILPELKEEVDNCIIKEVINALDCYYDLIDINNKEIQNYINSIKYIEE